MSSQESSITNNAVKTSESSGVNKLATQPLVSLFLSLAAPMAIGMLINGAYNLVDAYFVTHYVGEMALAAVSSIFPMNMFMIALAVMISNGTSVLLSRYLGRGDTVSSSQIAGVGLLLSILVPSMIILLGLTFQTPIFKVLGVTPDTEFLAKAYFLPLIVGSFSLFLLSLMSDFLRAINHMKGLMLIILIGAFCNIAFDALFIVVLKLGLLGAALATILSQVIAIVTASQLLKAEGTIPVSVHRLLEHQTAIPLLMLKIKEILSLGFPVFISYLGAVIVIGFVNSALMESYSGEGEIAVAAYGILSRINVFIILPLIAIANAGQTIIAYNFGAENLTRVKSAFVLCAAVATAYLTVMAIVFLRIPEQVLSVFSTSSELIEYGSTIAKVTFIGMPLAGLGFVSIAAFQALGKPKVALFLSSFKVYLVLIPLLVYLQKAHSVNQLWYAFPVSECMMFICVIVLLIHQLPKILQPQQLQVAG